MNDRINGWNEWGRHVLSELVRQNKLIEGMRDDISSMRTEFRTEIGMLKVKSGVWGLIGGAIPTATGLLIYFMTRG